MKKLISLLFVVLLSLSLIGCNNEFAELEYDSEIMLSRTGDNYAKEISASNTVNGEYVLTVSKFDGRETFWTGTLEQDQDIEVPFFLSISKGQVKIVCVDGSGAVTTVMECSPDTSTDEYVTKTLSLKSGKNKLKIVGYDCEELEFKMMVPEI